MRGIRRTFWIAWWGIVISLIYSTVATKRCLECRSRGPLGDCGDPFHMNASVPGRGVTLVPCVAGWCGKIKDGTEESTRATQRLCLPSPPSDNEERCGVTSYNNKMVFMCFCEGDLCNEAASSLLSDTKTTLLTLSLISLFFSFFVFL